MKLTFFDIERQDNVSILWLNRAEKRNQMNRAFWKELPIAMEELSNDDSTHCVVIAAKGKSFSLGLDVVDFLDDDSPTKKVVSTAEDRMQLNEMIIQMGDAMNSVAICPKPVIAAVQKHCIGGGLDLISACDYRFCSADAQFSILEVKLAIVADMGSLQRLPYIIGEGATRELAFTGKTIDASRARAMGLVNNVFDTHEELLTATLAEAREIAENSQITVRGIKHVLEVGRDMPIDQALNYVYTYNSAYLHSKDFIGVMQQRAQKAARKASA